MKKLLVLLAFIVSSSVYSQTTLRVASWNVESGGNNPNYIANRLKDFTSYDLIGLSEVTASNKSKYDAALGADYESVMGTTGRNDRLYIAYDKSRFELVGTMKELTNINIDGTVRAPLYVELKDKDRNENIIFMVNHLARSDYSGSNPTRNRRTKQAQMLNAWVKNIKMPVIAVGDYNFDFEIGANKHDDGFDAMLKDHNFFWLYPSNFQRTQCNTNYPAGILDFIFVNRQALIWSPKSFIQDHVDNCKKTASNSDHKAVLATFTMN